jgi:hypothetical protein
MPIEVLLLLSQCGTSVLSCFRIFLGKSFQEAFVAIVPDELAMSHSATSACNKSENCLGLCFPNTSAVDL